MIDFASLTAPLPPERVSWRVGHMTQDKKKAQALAYIDARDVYDRLDEVVGASNWQCRYSHADRKTICEIGIRIGDEWVWKANGAGDSDIEAEKGALSDAVKRAAVVWGIGRYLYDIKTPWVEVEPAGKSYKIKDSERSKLIAALGGPVAQRREQPEKPSWAVITTNGAGRAADDLVELVNMAMTTAVLDNTKKNEEFREKYLKLPKPLRERVTEAIATKEAELQAKVMEAG